MYIKIQQHQGTLLRINLFGMTQFCVAFFFFFFFSSSCFWNKKLMFMIIRMPRCYRKWSVQHSTDVFSFGRLKSNETFLIRVELDRRWQWTIFYLFWQPAAHVDIELHGCLCFAIYVTVVNLETLSCLLSRILWYCMCLEWIFTKIERENSSHI